MPRNTEKNAEVREERHRQIMNAALAVYVRLGYYGTDMDTVAKEARLAKGLVYYYFKTKRELFAALFQQMFDEGYTFSQQLLQNKENRSPLERLMHYTYGMFCANESSPLMMQFYMRIPFDAYAVFGPGQWQDGVQKSDLHRKALRDIIQDGINNGAIPELNADCAANSFWTVFVANTFEYSKLMDGRQQPTGDRMARFHNAVQFAFQGLGVKKEVWTSCMEKIISETGHKNEGV